MSRTALSSTAGSQWLTNNEVRDVMYAYLVANGPQTEDTLTEVVRWAERARIGNAALDAVLDGSVVMCGLENGEPMLAARVRGEE